MDRKFRYNCTVFILYLVEIEEDGVVSLYVQWMKYDYWNSITDSHLNPSSYPENRIIQTFLVESYFKTLCFVIT